MSIASYPPFLKTASISASDLKCPWLLGEALAPVIWYGILSGLFLPGFCSNLARQYNGLPLIPSGMLLNYTFKFFNLLLVVSSWMECSLFPLHYPLNIKSHFGREKFYFSYLLVRESCIFLSERTIFLSLFAGQFSFKWPK